MRNRRIAALALLLALGLGSLAACGGDDGAPGDDAKKAANEYFDALAAGDAGGVCDGLTKEAQAAFARQRKSKDCATAVGQILNGPQGDASKQIAKATEVDKVTVNGDNATAQAKSSQGIAVSLQMRREDGSWKISQLPGT